MIGVCVCVCVCRCVSEVRALLLLLLLLLFLVQLQYVDIAQFRSFVFRANVEPRKPELVLPPLTCAQRSEMLL
jgi:hypothetical protein